MFVHMCAQFRLAQNSACPGFPECQYCVIRGGSVLMFGTGRTRQRVVTVPALSRNFLQWALSGLYTPRKAGQDKR